MKRTLLSIILIHLAANAISQEIVGKILVVKTEIPIPIETILFNQEYFAVSNVSRQFILKHANNEDSLETEIHFIGFSNLVVKCISSSDNVNKGVLPDM